MAKDLTVILEDRPGTLADMGEALGKAGINIDGWGGIPCEGRGVIHVWWRTRQVPDALSREPASK